MPITGHTWSAEERKAARSFARSLGEERLQFARELTNRPTASAEDVVNILVQQKRELAWVAGYFDVKKPDIIKFFRSQRPIKADLRLTSLSKTSAEELKDVLGSYFAKGWKGSARALLTESAQQRDDDNAGPMRDLSRLKKISFNEPALAQIAALLLRVKERELDIIRQKLHIADAEFGVSKEQQVQAILNAVADEKGPSTLLNAMAERHVRAFLSEKWGQIAMANFGEDSVEDYIDYDMQTCQLCILWAWANM